jgi:hypothetical protein
VKLGAEVIHARTFSGALFASHADSLVVVTMIGDTELTDGSPEHVAGL